MVEERIVQVLYLDKPAEVRSKQKGFYVPFHTKDGKRYNAKDMIQPQVSVKTAELTSLEKEGLALHMKVFRLSKALGRPAANWEG